VKQGKLAFEPVSASFDEFIPASVKQIIEDLQANPTLPDWPDQQRALPNEILRSALFNARNHKQPRRFMRDAEIPTIGNCRITYRGEELRQDDELVWMHIVHLGKQQPLGRCIEFTPYSFVKAIGWPVKGDSYERLKKCLRRMTATAVSFQSERLGVGLCVSLVRRFAWQDEEQGVSLKKWQIWIEPEMHTLFNEDFFSRVDWEIRKALPTGIASKLHGYYASHKSPFPVKLETLMKLCDSEMTERHFKEQLKYAMTNLINAGVLTSWECTQEGLVSVKRK
jgi:hypothetical protein